MPQVCDKAIKNISFILYWGNQNVGTNCCVKIRAVFRLCEKLGCFFFSFQRYKRRVKLIKVGEKIMDEKGKQWGF